MSEFNDPNLLANKIRVTSMHHFNSLLNDGYEISDINWNWSAEDPSMVPTLLLEKGNQRLLADAREIADYVAQLQPLYDVKKKKNGFVWVPNTSLYFFLEQKFIDIALGDHSCSLSTGKLNVKNPQLVYESLYNWIKNNMEVKYENTNLPQLFYSVHVIATEGDKIVPKSYPKDSLDLITIQQLIHDSPKYDSSLAISFILLAEKNPNPVEMLVGFIMYDLKAKNTICFDIQSVASFKDQNPAVNERLETFLAPVALSLFNKSINGKMECKSYLPLPIYTDWYTPLPWLTYLALHPIQIKSRAAPEQRNMTIPEFLTFGYAEDYRMENSFHFKPFSFGTHGHAACILKFNDDNRRLKYILRFDQSSGEPLLHLDYSMYDEREKKFIAHCPVDLETIYQSSPDLFVAILAAGMCDGHFSSIIERGLKGVAELIAKNPAYFYPFKHMLLLEKAIDWFDEKPERYQILEKVNSREQLTNEEKDVVDYMHNNFIGIVARENSKEGTGFIGSTILLRLYRNQINVRAIK
jgi:hypothetical protein